MLSPHPPPNHPGVPGHRHTRAHARTCRCGRELEGTPWSLAAGTVVGVGFPFPAYWLRPVHDYALQPPCPGSAASRGTVLSLSLSLWIQTPLLSRWALDEPSCVPASSPVRLRRGRCPPHRCVRELTCLLRECMLRDGLAPGVGPMHISHMDTGDPLGCALLPSGSSP